MTGATLERRTGLTSDELAFFLEHGYLIVKDAAPRPFLEAIDRDIGIAYQEKIKDRSLSCEELNNSHDLGKNNPHAIAWSRDPSILDLVQGLVYPGIALFSAKVISKGPREHDMICHWHQDEAYWQDSFPRQRRVSLWMPLQDATPDNGCLRVVPGSHSHAVVPHLSRTSRDHGACRLSFAHGLEELPGAIEIPVRAGDLIIFSSRLQHSSRGNHTDQHRRAFILTYQEVVAASDEFEILRAAQG